MSASQFPRQPTSPVKTATPTQGSIPPPQPTSPPSDDPIDVLSARLGTSSEDEAQTLIAGTTDNALIDAGREVDTSRVTDDVVRVVTAADAFFTSAPAARRQKVRLAPDLLRVLAWTGAQGHHAAAAVQRAKASRRAKSALAQTSHAQPLEAARVARDQLAESLRSVAAGDAVARERVTAALAPSTSGSAETGPGRALASLVAIGRDDLASDDPGVRARCATYGLTREWLDACAVTAEAALAAERALNAPVARALDDQAAVDRWDGINLFLIERVVRAFAAAHQLDHAVPKIGVVSLRGVVGAHPRKPKKPTG